MELELWKHVILVLLAVELGRLYLKTRAAMKQRHKLELELLSVKNVQSWIDDNV